MSGADKGQTDRIPDRPGGSGPRTQLGTRKAGVDGKYTGAVEFYCSGGPRPSRSGNWLAGADVLPSALATTAELAFSALAAGALSFSAPQRCCAASVFELKPTRLILLLL